MSKIKPDRTVKEEGPSSGGGFRTPVPSGPKSSESPAFSPHLNARTARSTSPLPSSSASLRSDGVAEVAALLAAGSLACGELPTSALMVRAAQWLRQFNRDSSRVVVELEGELRVRGVALAQAKRDEVARRPASPWSGPADLLRDIGEAGR